MTAIVIGSWQVLSQALNPFQHHATGGRSHHLLATGLGVGAWPVPILVISLSIMVLVLVSGEAFLHLVGTRLTPTPPPVTTDDSSISRLPQIALEAFDYGGTGLGIRTNGADAEQAASSSLAPDHSSALVTQADDP
jgi:hypothetical protein